MCNLYLLLVIGRRILGDIMWFNIIKVDEITQDDIERIKAVQYKSEEDKKKIKDYERSKEGKERRKALEERLINLKANIDWKNTSLSFKDLNKFEAYVEEQETKHKRNAATEKSLGLLNKVIGSNNKVTIVTEPEFKHGSIYGKVKIEGESGHTYHYDFQNDPEIEKNIDLSFQDLREKMNNWNYDYPNVTESVTVPMCLSCKGDLPVGDNIASMILGLLNDEKSSEEIEVLDKALNDHQVIDWDRVYYHINNYIDGLDFKKFIVERYEE